MSHLHSTTPDEVQLPPKSVSVCMSAPVNIAVIKYWGKNNEKLIIPINSSLSATLDQGSMMAKTQIIASTEYKQDEIYLNHKKEDIESNKRLKAVIEALRSRASDYKNNNGNIIIKSEDWSKYKFLIVSVNNFPTAAGLASSAAGYACFTVCLGELLGFKEQYPGELTCIARQGSGSACRSLYSGWVQWIAGGENKDGSDSIAKQVVDHKYWPEIRILILVANNTQKETSSTDGMERSVKTSELLAYRAKFIVPKRMELMQKYIKERDFNNFGRLTMEDSNQFHACCLDTYPPIFYMNETSKSVIACVDAINTYYNTIIAAYTFDAGPNAVIYCLNDKMELLINSFLTQYLPNDQSPKQFLHDPMQLSNQSKLDSHIILNTEVTQLTTKFPKFNPQTQKIHQIIVTKVGDGPQLISKKDSF